MPPRGSETGRGTRFEVSTNTRDASLQLVFADPYGSLTQLGLAIPSAVPSFYSDPKNPKWMNRYLALLASQKFGPGEKFRLVGMRQRVLIGALAGLSESNPGYPVYCPVTTPEWHFSDATISWHLRRVELSTIANRNLNNAAELNFRRADTAAILFENAPAQVGGYGPPFGGQPPGNVFLPDLGSFHDMRFPWMDDHAWDSMDAEGEGPCAIELYASIQQTNPDTRPVLSLGGTPVNVLPPEEQFLQAFPSAIYTRIAGSLIFQTSSMHVNPTDVIECPPDCPPSLRGTK